MEKIENLKDCSWIRIKTVVSQEKLCKNRWVETIDRLFVRRPRITCMEIWCGDTYNMSSP